MLFRFCVSQVSLEKKSRTSFVASHFDPCCANTSVGSTIRIATWSAFLSSVICDIHHIYGSYSTSNRKMRLSHLVTGWELPRHFVEKCVAKCLMEVEVPKGRFLEYFSYLKVWFDHPNRNVKCVVVECCLWYSLFYAHSLTSIFMEATVQVFEKCDCLT